VIGLIALGVLRLARGAGDGHIQPKNPEVKKLMDQAFLVGEDLKRQADATTYLKRAIEIDPKYAPAWAWLFADYTNACK
jgi:hypothetical protein